MDFRRALAIIEKRRWIIIGSVLITAVLVYGVTRLMPSRWMATVRLITPTGRSDMRSVPEIGEADAPGAASMYRVLARDDKVMAAASAQAHVDTPLRGISENIEFEAAGAHMFELRYYDSEPGRAVTMGNALADNLIEQNRLSNSKDALRTVRGLEGQIRSADNELQALQSRYDRYCIQNDIIPGDFLSQVKDVAKEIEIAQTSKAEATARIAQNRARLGGAVPSVAPPPVEETDPVPTERENRISRQIDDLDTEIARLRAKYNDSYPELSARITERGQLAGKLAALRATQVKKPRAPVVTGPEPQRSIQDQIAADEALIQSEDMTIAQRKADLDRLKRVNSKLGNLPVIIAEKSEARSGLAARLNKAKDDLGVAERQNPLSVLQYASDTNPPVNTTAGRAIKLVGIASLLALLLAVSLAIALESADRRLKTVQEADEILPARVVAAIPLVREEEPSLDWARVAELRPLSPQSEAYRFLGQHVLSAQNRRYHAIMGLSARVGQGNTRMMANLAITLAQAGHSVILVDANLRSPMLHRVFELSNEVGFSDVLQRSDVGEIERALQSTPVRNLRVLTSGSSVTNPWELFSSTRLQEFNTAVRGMASYVLFDTPAALAYTDTLSLSTIVDATLLCVRAAEPLTGAEQRLGEMFALSEGTILGSVLMDAPLSLAGTYERDLRDVVHVPEPAGPALESGEPKAGDHSPRRVAAAEPAPRPAEPETAAEGPAEPAAQASDVAEPVDTKRFAQEAARQSNGSGAPSAWAAAPGSDGPEPLTEAPPAEAPSWDSAVPAPQATTSKESTPAEDDAAAESAAEPSAVEVMPASGVASAPAIVPTSEDASMDPAFIVNEPRLSTPPARPEPEEPDPYEARKPQVEAHAQAPDLQIVSAIAVAPEPRPEPQPLEITREENAMTNPNEPPGGFQKSIHGYNVGQVDDYIRKLNSRLEAVLSQVHAETVRADQSKRLLEQMTAEMETIRRRAADAEKREVAALEGQKRAEEEAGRLVDELKHAREKVRAELEAALADARFERDAVIEEERQDAEAIVAEARRAAQAQVAESQRLVESMQNDVTRMMSEVETMRALTTDDGAAYDEMIRSAEAQRAKISSDIDAQRAYARSQIEAVVNEARLQAEEAAGRAAAIYREHEEHVRRLGAECEALVHSVREAAEAQIAQIAATTVRTPVGAGARLRNDETDDKRNRENREWRTGDWRNVT
ncbi:MAG TPA: hypothetical protein VKT77_23110 [Chthonomonadaceae bacterium]|nr:hypothetical protein [Chthonomonadaceae bacterium]